MAGRGKGGKGLGKVGAKRHTKGLSVKTSGHHAFNKMVITRIARKGGVKRIGREVPEHVRDFACNYVRDLLQDVGAYVYCGKRKTVFPMHVAAAFRKRGRCLLGIANLGSHKKRHSKTKAE